MNLQFKKIKAQKPRTLDSTNEIIVCVTINDIVKNKFLYLLHLDPTEADLV